MYTMRVVVALIVWRLHDTTRPLAEPHVYSLFSAAGTCPL